MPNLNSRIEKLEQAQPSEPQQWKRFILHGEPTEEQQAAMDKAKAQGFSLIVRRIIKPTMQ